VLERLDLGVASVLAVAVVVNSSSSAASSSLPKESLGVPVASLRFFFLLPIVLVVLPGVEESFRGVVVLYYIH